MSTELSIIVCVVICNLAFGCSFATINRFFFVVVVVFLVINFGMCVEAFVNVQFENWRLLTHFGCLGGNFFVALNSCIVTTLSWLPPKHLIVALRNALIRKRLTFFFFFRLTNISHTVQQLCYSIWVSDCYYSWGNKCFMATKSPGKCSHYFVFRVLF